MKKLILLLFCFPYNLLAQISDDFSINGLPDSTKWIGNRNSFIVKNGKLQSNNQQSNSKFYLAAQLGNGKPDYWEFKISLDFNTSSKNYVDCILWSDSSNFLNSTEKVFLRIGNTKDECHLYYKNANKLISIIDGPDGVTHRFNTTLKVSLANDSIWSLWYNSSVLQGTYNIKQNSGIKYAGIFITQSTSSFFEKHFFDQIVLGAKEKDTILPKLEELEIVNESRLNLHFSESIDSFSLSSNNISIEPLISIEAIELVDDKTAVVQLQSQIPSNKTINIFLNGFTDLAKNKMRDTLVQFSNYQPQKGERFDVLINELMVDPEPAVELPETEYIELYNRSDKYINLDGWSILDTKTVVKLPPYKLDPKKYVLLCKKEFETLFSKAIPVLPLENLPTLNNSDDQLKLLNEENQLIHSVNYSADWYKNVLKKDGGWSLELIDARNPCAGKSNWKESENHQGGTPGVQNSVVADNPDTSLPMVENIFIVEDSIMHIQWSEKIIENEISLTDISLNPTNLISRTQLNNEEELELVFNDNFRRNIQYQFYIKNLKDCSGNTNPIDSISFAIPSRIEEGDLLINEIMYEPKNESVEFVEIYNASDKILSLSDLNFAQKDEFGNWEEAYQITEEPVLIFPKSYWIISENAELIKPFYTIKEDFKYVDSEEWPSLPNAGGNLYLINRLAEEIDGIHYDPSQHFELLENTRGVSLERLQSNKIPKTDAIFSSASSTAGFATPGYKNSQSVNKNNGLRFDVSPDPISPNNDGHNDRLNISYSLENPMTSLRISIYNSSGYLIKELLPSQLASSEGMIYWNGISMNAKVPPTGIYILFFEAFDITGNVYREKKVFTLINN